MPCDTSNLQSRVLLDIATSPALLCAAAEPHLLEGARRQLDLSRGLPAETRRRRLIMYLQRRGHNWDTISKLLQQTEIAS